VVRFAFTLVLVGLAARGQDGGLAPPQRLQTRASPDTVQLGEPFDVEVVVTHDPAQRYELPTPSDLGDFDYRGVDRSRLDGPTSSTTTFKVHLAAFALGEQRTPPLRLSVNEGGRLEQIDASGVKVTVTSTLPPDADQKGADLLDVRPPQEVPIRSYRLLYALAIALAVGLTTYLLFRWWRRPKALVTATQPLVPLHIRTQQALDLLAQENLPLQGKTKAFYFRLSEILRGYLGEKFGFDALESTTPELLAALRARQPPGLDLQAFASFAELSDMVRYAKGTSDVDECRAMLELGHRLVNATHHAGLPASGPAGARP
jgi:hypothetical protein